MSRLAELAVGDQAKVVQIDGDDEVSIRLLEMGLTPGVAVKLIGTAPLGDPMEFLVRGYRLSLRLSEAKRVAVERL